MTLTLTFPAPLNIYCNTCLMSTEHVDLEFDLEPKGKVDKTQIAWLTWADMMVHLVQGLLMHLR